MTDDNPNKKYISYILLTISAIVVAFILESFGATGLLSFVIIVILIAFVYVVYCKWRKNQPSRKKYWQTGQIRQNHTVNNQPKRRDYEWQYDDLYDDDNSGNETDYDNDDDYSNVQDDYDDDD